MAEIIDIVAKLEFESNTSNINKASEALKQNVTQLMQQLDAQKKLEAERDRTDKANIARINELTSKINQLKQASDAEIKTLTLKVKEQDKLTQSLQKQIIALGQASTKVTQFTKSSNSATFALTNLGRIVQDAPFGFIGIANNINPALESFQRLKAETGSTGTALKALGSSLIGAGGIGLAVSVVTSLLVVFGDKLFQSANKATDAEKALKKYNDTINNIEESSRRTAQSEIARINVLTSIAADTTQSTRQRGLAIKELQKEYPAYFGNLDKEILLQGQAKNAINDATNALLARAAATAAENKFAAASEKVYDLTLAQRKAIEDLDKARNRANKNRGPNVDPLLSGIVGQGVGIAEERIRDVNKELDKAIKEQQTFLKDAQTFAKQAGETIFKDSTLKEPKEKRAKRIREIIVPLGKPDIDDIALDIQRIETLIKTLNDILFNQTADRLANDDPFKLYAQSVKRSISGLEEEIISGFGPDTSDAQAEELFNSIRDTQIRNNTRLEQLREQLRKASGEKQLTEEEQIQIALLNIRLKHVQQVTDTYTTVVNAAAQAATMLIGIEQERNDRFIQIQQERVNYATELAKRGNVEVLNAERDRLEQAQKTRERLAQRQLQVNALLQASNSAVALTEAIGAIVAAAAKGDPYTIALRVAAAVASLVAGIAAIKGAFSSGSSNSFKDGVVGFRGRGTGTSDSNPVFISNGESVITARATKQHAPLLKAMNAGLPLPMATQLVTNDGSKKHYNSLEKKVDTLISVTEGNHTIVHNRLDERGWLSMTERTKRRERNRFR